MERYLYCQRLIRKNNDNLQNTPEIINNEVEFVDTQFGRLKYYEARNFNPLKVFIFVLTVLVSLLFGFVKDSMNISPYSGLDKCHTVQYVAVVSVSVVMILIQIYCIQLVIREQNIKQENNYHYDHEVVFNLKNTLGLTFCGFIIGFLANILGLGGGFVIFPMLVFIGVSPLVASACTMFLIFVSKIVAAIFAFMGEYLLPGYTFLTVALVCLSVIFFIKVMDEVLKR